MVNIRGGERWNSGLGTFTTKVDGSSNVLRLLVLGTQPMRSIVNNARTLNCLEFLVNF